MAVSKETSSCFDRIACLFAVILHKSLIKSFITFSSLIASSSCWQLIGPLKSCGMWTCYHDYKIHILNPHRVHETVLYHRLMNEHVLPSEALERPVKITQEYVLVHLSEKELLKSFDKKTIKLVVILYKREREERERAGNRENISVSCSFFFFASSFYKMWKHFFFF